ncbi:hypothetical protein K470DRAFT_68543 [Piedraia hortae CBS 480.64]|uniref:Uncharacterized protein n=1 Tax=Piedraia hortae CBS 480.64 TaxID=1314780 RepID=A0A6A7BZV3_9PEZI|nr:hypothetical protein K470DRAFT_68543 [Piedraia hortae CBS 480.64]
MSMSSDGTKIAYCYLLLRDNALKQMMCYWDISNGTCLISTMQDFWILWRSGSRRDRPAPPQDPQQGKRDFAEYIAEFSQHAPRSRFNDTAKRSLIFDGLSQKMKDLLRRKPIRIPFGLSNAPGTFQAYINDQLQVNLDTTSLRGRGHQDVEINKQNQVLYP